MCAWLYEYVLPGAFANCDNSKVVASLETVFRNLGECNIEQVVLFGKSFSLRDTRHFSVDKEDGQTVLSYNKYEMACNKESYVYLDPEKFDGVRVSLPVLVQEAV